MQSFLLLPQINVYLELKKNKNKVSPALQKSSHLEFKMLEKDIKKPEIFIAVL